MSASRSRMICLSLAIRSLDAASSLLSFSSDVPSPSPVVIPPSSFWIGDNGQWSSFSIEAGTPGQAIEILPGTSASASNIFWLVIDEGCTEVNPTLTHCDSSRGGIFKSNASTTWSTQGLANGVDGAIYSLTTVEEAKLGLAGNGSYGFDSVSLGIGTSNALPTLGNQLIAGIWTDDFYIGQLPLSPYSFNFSTFNNPIPSMLANLRNSSAIPSLSWSYTAGAIYQDSSSNRFGCLVLGGFDASRFTQNNITFSFGPDYSRDLLLKLTSITYSTISSSPLLARTINIYIDSLVSEIWLPIDVCDSFAETFHLTYNGQGELYLVGDSAHSALLAQNPSFNFTFSNGSQSISISLPYAAFDLNLTSPIVGNTTRYFPIKRAQNDSQYVLGRTFLQEAYIIADYDRRQFSVSQAQFPASAIQQEIVAIQVPGNEAAANAQAEISLSNGAIAGIVVGALAFVAMITIAVGLLHKKVKRSDKLRQHTLLAEPGNDGPFSTPVHGLQDLHEIDCDKRQHELPVVREVLELTTDKEHHELPVMQKVLELDSDIQQHELSTEKAVVELNADEQEHAFPVMHEVYELPGSSAY